MSQVIRQSGDKFLIKDNKGTVREVRRDREGIKRGDYLQPIGKEKDTFLERYGYLPTEDRKDTDKYLNNRGLGSKPYENYRGH